MQKELKGSKRGYVAQAQWKNGRRANCISGQSFPALQLCLWRIEHRKHPSRQRADSLKDDESEKYNCQYIWQKITS
jgi:hypothetical protein